MANTEVQASGIGKQKTEWYILQGAKSAPQQQNCK